MKTNPWEDKYQEIMKNQQKESMDFSMDDLIEKATPEKTKKHIFYWVGGIAASVVAAVLIGFLWMNHETNNVNVLAVEQKNTKPSPKEAMKTLQIHIPDLKKVVIEPSLAKVKEKTFSKKENKINPKPNNREQKPLHQQDETKALVILNGEPIYDKEIAMKEVNYTLMQVDEKLKKVSKYTKKIEQLMIKI